MITPVNQQAADLTVQLSTGAAPAVKNATANNLPAELSKVLQTSIFYENLSRLELGFDASANANSNAFGIAANTGVLTVSQNGGAAVPDLREVFQVGDILVFSFTTQGAIRSFFVSALLSATTVQLLSGAQITGALGSANDGEDTLISCFRHNASGDVNTINIAKNKSKFDVCWKPTCLSIFNYPGAIPGGCKFELELQALAQKYVGLAVETPFGVEKIGRTGTSINNVDFQLLVKRVRLYICQVQGPIAGQQEYSYYINLNEIRAHQQKITSGSLTQTTLDVMPSSYALALAFQDNRAQNDGNTDLSITKFKVNDSEELALTRYSIRFAGISLPQPDAELKFSSSEEFLNNQYIRNAIYLNQYYKPSGGESLQQWKERGIYFYHPFVRSAGNRESRCYVITQFNQDASAGNILSNTGLDNLNAFIFEFYRAFALIKMKNGFVYDVNTANQ